MSSKLSGQETAADAQALALTLEERLSVGEPVQVRPAPPAGSIETAVWRRSRWRSQSPFQKAEFWGRRLQSSRLTEEAFLFLLAEGGASLSDRMPEGGSWWHEIEDALTSAEGQGAKGPVSFVRVIQPLFARFVRRLDEGLSHLVREFPEARIDPPGVRPHLLAAVTQQLDLLLSRTVVLELNVAKLQKKLVGNDSRERFVRFLDDLSQPDRAIELLTEYPVLARLVVETLELWLESTLELLTRLAGDWNAIRKTFSPDENPGPLAEVVFSQGDRHRGGRSVCRLAFASGLRLVYKPRSLAMDLRFEEFLRWFEARGGLPQRSAKILDRQTYGWSEFVAPAPCRTRDEVRRFYRRQGQFLALLHVLRAHDFHRENLVAAGEHPVLIDLETLCGPDYGRGDPANFSSLAAYELANSVTRVMLLPYLQEGLRDEAIEPSGLGGEEGQHSLIHLPAWEHRGTDEMRLGREPRPLPSTSNHPNIDGVLVDPREFAADVRAGFEGAYRLLLANREELLGDPSPLDEFRGVEARVIVRDTALYSLVLGESFHPDVLRNALDRDRLFDRLWFGMDFDPVLDSLEPLLPYEIADLWRGDVPHFVTSPESRDLTTSRGVTLPGFLARSGLEMIRATLEGMSELDLARQADLVRDSFAALTMSSESERQPLVLSRQPEPATRERLVALASAVADRLRELARVNGPKASWIGLRPLSRGWQLRSLSIDLYSGLPGVALALAHAARSLEREDLLALARGALATLDGELKRIEDYWTSLGAYMGWGGILYTYLHLGALWDDEELFSAAERLVQRLEPMVARDRVFDLVFGAAGSVPPLIDLWRLRGHEPALRLATRMGEHVLAGARRLEAGIGWVTIEPDRALTGFSHGGAGFAWMLTELFDATGDDRFRSAAEEALAFETSVFDESARNWPDFRTLGHETHDGPRFAAMWCNGAGGIGLSRLRILRSLPLPRLHADAEAALETVLRLGFGDNHCLCHGDLGNLELLLEGAETLGGRWTEELERQKARVVTSFEEHGWRCGIPRSHETPSLFEGLAGIAYGLLRLADPEAVPSVLLLDLPKVREVASAGLPARETGA